MSDLNFQRPATDQVEVDAPTWEAIERGLKAVEEGRSTPLEKVRQLIPQWISKFKSPTQH